MSSGHLSRLRAFSSVKIRSRVENVPGVVNRHTHGAWKRASSLTKRNQKKKATPFIETTSTRPTQEDFTMVNSNEGLEALAALASAVPASADTGSGKDRNGSNDSNQNGPRGQDQQAGNHQNMLAPSAQGNTNGMQGQTPGSAPFPQIHNQQLQSVLQATATNPQWQQALAAASANATGTSSPVAQAPNANNNSNNNSNHQQINALANLQRQLQQADPSALMAIQQQLNYLNLLQLAQSNQHQQQQQQTSLPPPLPQQQANPQLQALQLALAGRNISGLSSLLGGAPSTGTYARSSARWLSFLSTRCVARRLFEFVRRMHTHQPPAATSCWGLLVACCLLQQYDANSSDVAFFERNCVFSVSAPTSILNQSLTRVLNHHCHCFLLLMNQVITNSSNRPRHRRKCCRPPRTTTTATTT